MGSPQCAASFVWLIGAKIWRAEYLREATGKRERLSVLYLVGLDVAFELGAARPWGG